jgi:hypothetical protein
MGTRCIRYKSALPKYPAHPINAYKKCLVNMQARTMYALPNITILQIHMLCKLDLNSFLIAYSFWVLFFFGLLSSRGTHCFCLFCAFIRLSICLSQNLVNAFPPGMAYQIDLKLYTLLHCYYCLDMRIQIHLFFSKIADLSSDMEDLK